jgi:hypothetical protein
MLCGLPGNNASELSTWSLEDSPPAERHGSIHMPTNYADVLVQLETIAAGD